MHFREQQGWLAAWKSTEDAYDSSGIRHILSGGCFLDRQWRSKTAIAKPAFMIIPSCGVQCHVWNGG